MECIITWKEIIKRVNKLDKSKKYFGVPRGGQPIAAMLNPVDTPEEADIIIDDLIDSGTTRNKYVTEYRKPFIALFNKQKEKDLKNKWLIFPWEVKEEIPVEENFIRILEYLGEDTQREGLKDTPKRYIKFLKEFLHTKEFNFTTFDAEGTDEMIIQTNIPFYSLCEHHIAPFFGIANVAYIPNKKIVGLSKLARTVDLYSNKLQNQERITTQIAERLMKELNPLGVAVSMKAQHLCMCMRGVKKHDTWTTTSKMVGVFKDNLNARNEFLSYIK
jgi:GTP cyclohydrolase I